MKKLRELKQMLSERDVKYSYILKKLIIVSICEIFKDIVPSYKIRTWTEKENQQKVNYSISLFKPFYITRFSK